MVCVLVWVVHVDLHFDTNPANKHSNCTVLIVPKQHCNLEEHFVQKTHCTVTMRVQFGTHADYIHKIRLVYLLNVDHGDDLHRYDEEEDVVVLKSCSFFPASPLSFPLSQSH